MQHNLAPTEPPPDHDDVPRGDQPPHDYAAEQAVIGSMLISAQARDTALAILHPQDYWRPIHEQIHTVIAQMHQNGDPIDPITVAATIGPQALAKVGGPIYLHDLTTNTNPPAAAHYATIIQTKARQRTIAQAGNRLIQASKNGTGLEAAYTLAYETLDKAAADHGPQTRPNTTWAPMPLDAVLEGNEIDPPPSLLQRSDGQPMLYAGAIHTFSGEPGSGKTWCCLEAARQELANGHIVTMIDFEDRASRVIGRLLGLGAHPDHIRDRFRYIRPNTPIDSTSQHDLDQATHGATLVILDGVTEAMTLHGLDLNNNADIATFYGLLPRPIADQGAAVTMIDHVVKDTEKQGRWGIGGQHKLAGIDGVAYLVKTVEPFGRGKAGHARITVSKDRPGYIEEIALGRTVAELWLDARDPDILRCELRAPTAAPTDDLGNMRPTYLMEKISRWLELTPGANKKAITDAKFGKAEYVNLAIAHLFKEGYIDIEDGPNRQKFHRVVQPFREDD